MTCRCCIYLWVVIFLKKNFLRELRRVFFGASVKFWESIFFAGKCSFKIYLTLSRLSVFISIMLRTPPMFFGISTGFLEVPEIHHWQTHDHDKILQTKCKESFLMELRYQKLNEARTKTAELNLYENPKISSKLF